MAPPPPAPARATPAEPSPSVAIELLISAEDAARLARLPALAGLRCGRPKKTSLLTVWHDSAARDLSHAGLSLSETRGLWRLEKLRPAEGDDWLPAMPPPVLAEAGSAEAAAAHIQGPFAPLAAFSGHRRDFALTVDGMPAQLSLLEGELRGVAHSRGVCRLGFAGDREAMARLAAMLSGHVALAPPTASLGDEALALAGNAATPPRRLGGPEVAPGSTVGDAFCLIAGHLADVILFWATKVPIAASDEPVHQMRVALRRLRSALSIFRRALRDDTGWLDALADDLKALAAFLGVARDWDVFLAGIGAEAAHACNDDARLLQMLAAGARKRDAAYAALREYLADSPAWRRLALELALLPSLRPWDASGSAEQAARLAEPAAPYAAEALDRRLKHVLRAGETLDELPAEALHEIRKHAKMLRYIIGFFSPLFPEKQVRRYLARLEDVQEDFGTFNDAAIAAGLAASLGGGADRAFAAGAVLGFGGAAQHRARRHVTRGWRKFYRATPFWD